MSTRSKTRLAASSSTANPVSSNPHKPEQKSRTLSKSIQSELSESDQPEKENVKVNPPKRANKTPPMKRKATKPVAFVHCTCNTGDDGSPMINCSGCKVWYHFRCVELGEKEAEDINIYVCPSCTETSGRRTARDWEGPQALEEYSDSEPIRPKSSKKQSSLDSRPKRPVDPVSESEEDPSSEDDYIADELQSKAAKRRNRRLSLRSESDSELSDSTRRLSRTRPEKSSLSPAPNSRRLKRKNPHTSLTPPIKRKKVSESNATDDPTRKYCLGKLEELSRDIYFRYPHTRTGNQEQNAEQEKKQDIVQKPLEELTEEEKTELLDESKRFAAELEKCIYDIYSEPDKQGNPSAGSKYKDRFRMLQFNLSKVDRVVIHQRIAAGQITPKEISLMSSTDLANEETKQSIKIAEKEALEYSILIPTTIPRAKITHKGLEDIEDAHGEVTSLQEQERARIEEEERRDRERTARLRTQKRQRTTSTSVPPESPIVIQQSPSWGAPPPVPMHALSSAEESSPVVTTANQKMSANPMFAHTESDLAMGEPEINLADFINIDDEVPNVPDTTPTSQSLDHEPSRHIPAIKTAEPPPVSPTGISPFAAKPETPSSTSFSLDSLWNAPKTEIPVATTPPSQAEERPTVPETISEEPKDVIMEPDTTEADDQDFDMFLEEKDTPATSPEALQAAFDALPHVWSGKINMPLDSTIPQETPVVARQMGGKSLASDSPLWKTLFPSDLLRIDGRVPVDNSCKFLLQMRMNVTKELIAVAFSPASDSSDAGFRILSDFLIAKGRHGLVFPWGNRPKDHHPGRELYIIPLLSSDPLPDYMELLDDLHLPKIRKLNYLVGIWVLNKGKLAAPPEIPTTIIPHIPASLHLPMLNAPPSIHPAPIPNPPPPAPLPAAIAAEVASLTPEQIQLMIRTLSGNAPLPVLPTQTPLMPLPPHVLVPTPVPPPPQPWSKPTHNYPGTFPPNPPPHHALHHQPPHPQPPHSPHDHRDYGPHSRPGPRYGQDNGDRGWRGGRGRGRGRGNEPPSKPIDSGWPRRPRNDGGGPGPSSPARRW